MCPAPELFCGAKLMRTDGYFEQPLQIVRHGRVKRRASLMSTAHLLVHPKKLKVVLFGQPPGIAYTELL